MPKVPEGMKRSPKVMTVCFPMSFDSKIAFSVDTWTVICYFRLQEARKMSLTDSNENEKDDEKNIVNEIQNQIHVQMHHDAFEKGRKEFERQRFAAMKGSLPKQKVSEHHHQRIVKQSRRGQ
jgi:hypothetical protein